MKDYMRLKQYMAILSEHNRTGRPILKLTNGVLTEKEVINEIIHSFNDLIDEIEQGLILKLPCKVGDTVYMPWEYDGVSGVAELTVNDIFLDLNIGSSSIQTNLESDVAEYMRRYRYGLFEFNEVGKEIFLTKAEAEAKLQELKGEQK